MKIRSLCLSGIVACVAWPAASQATPKLQFETNFFDFGHLAGVESVSGSFKFKNVGDAVLKLDPPHPSCGCTDAKAIPDTLAPGESGVVSYKITLDHPMVKGEKVITIVSNDPQGPSVALRAQLEYDQVYQIADKSIRVSVPPKKVKPPKASRLCALTTSRSALIASRHHTNGSLRPWMTRRDCSM